MATPNAIEIRAAAVIEAGEENTPQRFRVDPAYSGGLLRVANYSQPVVIALDGLSYAQAIRANLDHQQDRRVGHIDEQQNTGRSLSLAGVVSAESDASREFVASAQKGFPWGASIEALPTEPMQQVEPGKTVRVNGQSLIGPFLLATKSVLNGIALLSRPADATTRAVLAGRMEATMAKALPHMTYEQIRDAGNEYFASIEPIHASTGDPVIDQENQRLRRIDMICGTDPNQIEAVYGALSGRVAELKASAIANELSIDELRGAMLETLRASRPKGVPPIRASSNPETDNRVIEAAMCQALALPGHEKHFDDRTLQAAHDAFRGRIGLQQMLIMAACANGADFRPGDRLTNNANIKKALRYALDEDFAPVHGAASTLSLPTTLGNVANRELLQGYLEEDQSWREIAETKPVSNFLQHTSVRMLDNFEYEELPPSGKIAHGRLGEESYTRQAKTYAKMFELTRVDIINDDMGAFDDLRKRLGRGAAQKFNKYFWAKFLDNSTFFTAGRGNYITGATTNLGLDTVGLELAVTAFRKLRSPAKDGSKRVGITGRPEILLVPPELEFIAKKIFASVNVAAAASTSLPDANIHAGQYRPVVCDFLSDATFTGNSATAWYLLRNPALGAALVVSLLNGNASPTVESADADFDTLGVAFRGYHDWGVDQAEYLCGVKSKGAA